MSNLADMMAADLSAFTASQAAPLQSEPAVVTATAESAPVPAESPVQMATETAPQVTEGAASGQPEPAQPATEQTPAQEDEFNIDLDKDPTQPDADAPTAETGDVSSATADDVDPDSKVGEYLATPRGKRIYAAYKDLQTLAKPDEEGGIGHRPTPDQIKEYFRTYADVTALQNDFLSATPDGVNRWAQRWFDPQNGEAAAIAARQLMTVLPNGNPQAYGAARSVVLNREIVPAVESLIERVRSTEDQAQAERYYYAAQELHNAAFGRYFDPAIVEQRPAPQNQPHPAELELQRIRSEQQRSQQAQAQSEYQAITSDIDSALDRALDADVDEALKPIKGQVPDVIYRGVKKDLKDSVKADLSRNKSALNVLETNKSAVARMRDRNKIPDLVRAYRSMALEPLRSRRVEYINAAGRTLKEQNDQRHAQLQQAASKTEPASTQVPVQRDLSPAIARQPGETQEQFMMRSMMADFQRTNSPR